MKNIAYLKLKKYMNGNTENCLCIKSKRAFHSLYGYYTESTWQLPNGSKITFDDIEEDKSVININCLPKEQSK